MNKTTNIQMKVKIVYAEDETLSQKVPNFLELNKISTDITYDAFLKLLNNLGYTSSNQNSLIYFRDQKGTKHKLDKNSFSHILGSVFTMTENDVLFIIQEEENSSLKKDSNTY